MKTFTEEDVEAIHFQSSPQNLPGLTEPFTKSSSDTSDGGDGGEDGGDSDP